MREKQTRLEPSRALLIHLGARRDAVDRHKEQLARTHHRENAVNVLEDALGHLVLVGRVVLRARVGGSGMQECAQYSMRRGNFSKRGCTGATNNEINHNGCKNGMFACMK